MKKRQFYDLQDPTGGKIWLTPKSLSIRWHTTLGTLSQWRWNGVGPLYFKKGKGVLYDLQEVERFENDNMRQSTSQFIELIKKEEDQERR